MPEDTQSRFTVLERPTESPGQCLVCGAVDRPVVDFGVDIDWADLGFGRAYLCVFCVKQAASKFPEPVAEVDTSEEILQALRLQKETLYDGLRSYLDSFASDRYSSIPVYGSPDSVPESTEPSDTQDIEPELQREHESSDGSAVEASSDDSGEGPVSVSGNSGDGREPRPFSFDL